MEQTDIKGLMHSAWAEGRKGDQNEQTQATSWLLTSFPVCSHFGRVYTLLTVVTPLGSGMLSMCGNGAQIHPLNFVGFTFVI